MGVYNIIHKILDLNSNNNSNSETVQKIAIP